MKVKYSIVINDDIIQDNFKRIINQIYKLLPTREEGSNWQKPLETIMVELSGMERLFEGQQYDKLEGLFSLDRDEDFSLYRRTIFECLGLLSKINNNVGT